jgi:LysM repeat protein
MYTEGDTQKYTVKEGDSLLEIALNNNLGLKELMLLK